MADYYKVIVTLKQELMVEAGSAAEAIIEAKKRVNGCAAEVSGYEVEEGIY